VSKTGFAINIQITHFDNFPNKTKGADMFQIGHDLSKFAQNNVKSFIKGATL
jgi:hypothetical protein